MDREINRNRLKSLKEQALGSFDIIDNLIINSSYAMIVIDKNYKVLYVNESVLRLLDVPIDKIYQKNYLGVFTRNNEDYQDFCDFYRNISRTKKPTFIRNNQNNTNISAFPVVNKITKEVDYFINIFTVDKFMLTADQKNELRFSHDYVYFAHQLSLLLDAKDNYTANHSSNVAKYSGLLGSAIGIKGIELEQLILAANLHDIGKVHIPSEILNKESQLLKKEYELIQNHPVYTGKILQSFKRLKNVGEGGLYHHERFDGKGYPEGLYGTDIPIFARIIAIADSFDAMTTDRYYRKAMPVEVARDELLHNKHTQFDPFLVDKFLNLDLEKHMDSLNEFDTMFSDEYTISEEQSKVMHNNILEMGKVVDAFSILFDFVYYNLYGFIIAKDLGDVNSCEHNRFEILYMNEVIENFEHEKYIKDNWHMCLKSKISGGCHDCPVDACYRIKGPLEKKTLLKNEHDDSKFLDSIIFPHFDVENSDSYILHIFKDETLLAEYGNELATEFFGFVDNITKIFSEQHQRYSIIHSEIRGLANWIAEKLDLAEYMIQLLNKSLSVCDLGIIAIYDSSEYTFESLNVLRSGNEHIEIINDLITELKTFADIKDIVLYHHTDYYDDRPYLNGDNIPIQSYIINISDYLLTYLVMGKDIDEILSNLEASSGLWASPTVCSVILQPENKKELREILVRIKTLRT